VYPRLKYITLMHIKNTNTYRFPASLLALSAVLLGAFGAHALKDTLMAHDSIGTWETAVRYQMWHALALLMLSLISEQQQLPRITGICFIVGTLLFSGSLYGLALDGPKWLGPITPLGGLCLIIGWGLLAYSCVKNNAQ
jgi:uncharacterized membrane protein YgdD (TMEM256/DUF423 family)